MIFREWTDVHLHNASLCSTVLAMTCASHGGSLGLHAQSQLLDTFFFHWLLICRIKNGFIQLDSETLKKAIILHIGEVSLVQQKSVGDYSIPN